MDEVEDTALIDEESEFWLSNNPILASLRDIGLTNEKPMTPLNMFKFLEELMNNKHKTDQKDIVDKRKPRLMTEFLMEHLQRVFGIPKLALRNLSQLVPALQQQFQEGNQYAALFCRLLQLFHPQPIPYHLALFLIKARNDFGVMNEKYEKTKQSSANKAGNKPSNKNRDVIDIASTGGYAHLTDVIEYVYRTFTGDREAGTLILNQMKPFNLPVEDIIAYKICHKMSKLGKSSESLFSLIDKDGDGSVDINEFVKGCRSNLDLWVTPENIRKLFTRLDVHKDGRIRKETFLSVINIKSFQNLNKTGKYLITKSSFLNALTDIFMIRQRRDAAYLLGIINKYDYIDQDLFESTVRRIDSSLPVNRIAQLYKEAVEISKEKPRINPNAFTRALLRNGIGKWGLGNFKIQGIVEETSFFEEKKISEPIVGHDFMSVLAGSKLLGLTNQDEEATSDDKRRFSIRRLTRLGSSIGIGGKQEEKDLDKPQENFKPDESQTN